LRQRIDRGEAPLADRRKQKAPGADSPSTGRARLGAPRLAHPDWRTQIGAPRSMTPERFEPADQADFRAALARLFARLDEA
jgi:hypothetical protein